MEPENLDSLSNPPSDEAPTENTENTGSADNSEATEVDQDASPSFGWNSYAERINGRFAMIGFVALLVLELITRQDFFTWLGL